jgi:hypothetical protein
LKILPRNDSYTGVERAMPFDGAAAGNVDPWTHITEEANERVCTVLRSFISSRLKGYPNGSEFLTCGRDALYAYFRAGQHFLGDQLNLALEPYKERLFALDLSSYLQLLCALHMEHLVLVHVSRNRPSSEAGWFSLVTEGAGDIYGRPRAYVTEWRNQLDWFSDTQHGPARIVLRTYEEIASLVGSPPHRLPVFERLFWSDIGLRIAERAKAMYGHANWRQTVEVELASH